MSYARHTDLLQFPSGRSVGNCRNDAKGLQKSTSKSLHTCLDWVAKDNGYPEGWNFAIENIVAEALQRTQTSPNRMTMDDLLSIAKRNQKLTQYGIGLFGLLAELDPDFDYQKKLEQERASLPLMLPECNRALAYVSMLEPQREINDRPIRKSYELKHLAEFAFQNVWPRAYIPHGAFIIAALFKGFLPQRCSSSSLSVYFNINENSPILHWHGASDGPIADALRRQLEGA